MNTIRNRVLAGVMIAVWVAIVGFVLCGCAGRSGGVTPAVVKPSIAPVTKPVAETRRAVSSAAVSLSEATQRAVRASEMAREIEAAGVEAHSERATALASEVETLRGSLFRAQASLREAEDRLSETETRIAELDTVIGKQTDALNQANADRDSARAEVTNLQQRLKVAESERAAAQRSLWWAKAQKWLVGGGLVALFVGAYALKFIGAGARLAM